MAKNKFSKSQIEKLQSMSYQELGKAVVKGDYALKDLRKAYTQMRDIAMKRIGRITSEKNVKQFGKPNLYMENGEYFRKTKNIVSGQELLKEIADVSKFLKGKSSTVTGLREIREQTINRMQEEGFDIDESNYLDFRKFMAWFKASEYAKLYDSDSPVVSEVFNSEKASPEEWKKAFEEFSRYERNTHVRQY